MNLLPQEYYLSEDVVFLAKDLLGKILITSIDGVETSGIIVETEAYRGPDDKACHAFGNKKTERTKSIFLPGGHAYVYICYGVHPMMNVVTGPENTAHAILIRAIEPITGQQIIQTRRNISKPNYTLTNGPGKLATGLTIQKIHDGVPLFTSDSPIRICDAENIVDDSNIHSGPRVGMSIHTGTCAHRPWRFYIKNNPWVSKPLKVDYNGKW